VQSSQIATAGNPGNTSSSARSLPVQDAQALIAGIDENVFGIQVRMVKSCSMEMSQAMPQMTRKTEPFSAAGGPISEEESQVNSSAPGFDGEKAISSLILSNCDPVGTWNGRLAQSVEDLSFTMRGRHEAETIPEVLEPIAPAPAVFALEVRRHGVVAAAQLYLGRVPRGVSAEDISGQA
jgi:hypothetical protein